MDREEEKWTPIQFMVSMKSINESCNLTLGTARQRSDKSMPMQPLVLELWSRLVSFLFTREINRSVIITIHANSFLWHDLYNQHTLELLTLTTCKSCSSWGQECRSYAKLNLFHHLPNLDACHVLIFGLRFAFHHLSKLWQCLRLDDENNTFFVILFNNFKSIRYILCWTFSKSNHEYL